MDQSKQTLHRPGSISYVEDITYTEGAIAHSLLNLSSKPSSDAFIQSIIDAQKIIEISVYSIDATILIASCLEILAKQTEISPLIQFFIKSKIFDPQYTIFSKGGLNPTISIIRNSIFKIIPTFSMVEDIRFIEILHNLS